MQDALGSVTQSNQPVRGSVWMKARYHDYGSRAFTSASSVRQARNYQWVGAWGIDGRLGGDPMWTCGEEKRLYPTADGRPLIRYRSGKHLFTSKECPHFLLIHQVCKARSDRELTYGDCLRIVRHP